MNIEFLSTVAVIAPDLPASRKLYLEALGLPLESRDADYHHSEQIAGCKSFGTWPLSQAAEACFGTAQWPVERPVPQVSIEFDVAGRRGSGPGGAGARAGRLGAAARTAPHQSFGRQRAHWLHHRYLPCRCRYCALAASLCSTCACAGPRRCASYRSRTSPSGSRPLSNATASAAES